MLEEFLSFKGEEMPPMDENPPKYIWNMKIERPLKSSAYSKYSELNLESLNKLEEEKMTLAEKVMKRQMEEKANLEEIKKQNNRLILEKKLFLQDRMSKALNKNESKLSERMNEYKEKQKRI